MNFTHLLLFTLVLALVGAGLACLNYRRLYREAIQRHTEHIAHIRQTLDELTSRLTGRNEP